jgi:hypothetical protein
MEYEERVRDYTKSPSVDLPLCSTEQPATSIAFGEALSAYLAAGGEARYATPQLRALCDAKLLREIDQGWIEDVAQTLKPHAAASTKDRQVYTLISAVLKFAAARDWCRAFTIVRPQKTKRERPSLPSPEELQKFLGRAGPGLKRIIKFKLATDATEYEILTLDWKQVSSGLSGVYLQKPNGSGRLLPLSPDAAEVLARQPHRDGRVFRCDNGRPYKVTGDRGGRLKNAFDGASQRSGIRMSFGVLHHICRAGRDYFGMPSRSNPASTPVCS